MKHYFRSVIAVSAILSTMTAFAAEPVAPSSVTAVSTPAGVVIAWQPVTEDIDENVVDPETVIYDVYRCDTSDEKVLVGSDITTTSYTDVLGEITGEVYYRWQVIAKTADGSSSQYEGYSELLGFGDGAAIPYIETFSTKEGWSFTADNYWLAETTEGWNGFEVDDELFFDNNGEYLYIHGTDYTEDNVVDGFLYIDPSKWSDTDASYTSGGINLSDAENPTISLSYYIIPGGHNSFQVRIIDSEGTAHEIMSSTTDGEAFGWKKTNDLPLTQFKSQKIRIQFHASYYPDSAPSTGVRAPICLDNIKVAEGESSGIESIATECAAGISCYSLDGRRVTDLAAGQLVIKVERQADGSAKISKVITR